MLLRIAVLITLVASSVRAADTMSAEEFERYSTGKTLFYGNAGEPYGAEQYLPGRRVIWTYLDGECQEGIWYEQAGLICFQYERSPDEPQCWSFLLSGSGLTARYENDPAATVLIEVEQSDEPLICPGPKVGA